MHDCLQTQDHLIDLVFDELDAATRARLSAEVAACASCGAQYRSLVKTLDVCDEASASAMPRASYWPQYHAALSRRLHAEAGEMRAERSVPFWKQLLTTSIRVPAPIAASALLLLLATSILALSLLARSAPEPVVVAAPASSQGDAAPQIRFIEVPVVQEKIITQTVYVPRRNRSDDGGDVAAKRRATARENLAGVERQNAPATEAITPARANLSGFKPAGEVNLRIIKGSDAREQ
jgi:anti-sigma factor RsiW